MSFVLSWYFFIVTIAYNLLWFFSTLQPINQEHFLFVLFRYKKSIFFALYTAGFIYFVSTLKMKYVKDQIGFFFWSVLAIIYLTSALTGIMVVYNGLIWFLMVILMVTMNDTFALLGGKFFGKHPLWKLSPKKTVEGFIVGFLGTILVGYLLIQLSKLNIQYLLCPQTTLTLIPFAVPSCEIPYIFVERDIYIRVISGYFGTFRISEFSIHVMIFVIIASLVAPFGGFFASGLKRALNVKDFSNIIPGHGGFTDRIDCIWVLLLFSQVYTSEILKGKLLSLSSVMNYMERLQDNDL